MGWLTEDSCLPRWLLWSLIALLLANGCLSAVELIVKYR